LLSFSASGLEEDALGFVTTGFTSFLGEGDLCALGSGLAALGLAGGEVNRSAKVASVLAFFAGGDRAHYQYRGCITW
jgi:hypothetical protein